MSRAREKLPQIGLWDAEVPKPDHDAICLWVYENAETVVRAAFPKFERDWREDDFEDHGLQPPEGARERAQQRYPRPSPRVGGRTLEYVLQREAAYARGTGQIVGYADVMIQLELPAMVVPQQGAEFELRWHQSERARVLVEVKSILPTLGELMRQLNLYRTAHHGPVVVVSPDARYAAVLAEQGIAFVQSPTPLPERASRA